MKNVWLQILIAGSLISGSAFAIDTPPYFGKTIPDSVPPKLILTCEGAAEVRGGRNGNEYTGSASLQIYRREHNRSIGYSAIFNAYRPNDPVVKDKLFLALTRSFLPSSRPNRLATGFDFIAETDDNKNNPSKLSFRITEECVLNIYTLAECPSGRRLPVRVYLKTEVTEKVGPSRRLYFPELRCKWGDDEGHLNFYGK